MKYRDIFILLLFLLIYLGLRPAEVITGHWHLTRIDENGGYSALEGFSTIDIKLDSTLVLDKISNEYSGFEGKLFEDGILRIGPSCWGFSGEYKFEKGTLYLIEKNGDKEDIVWMGKKEDSFLCNKQEYFFRYTEVAVDLPISTKSDTSKEASLEISFYCGIPKPVFQEEYGDDYILQVGHLLKEEYDFDLYEEKHRIKVVDNKRDRIYRTIYADQGTPLSTFYPLIKYYREKQEGKIYLATRNADTFSEVKIFLRKLNIYDPVFTEDNPQTLNNWLRSEGQ